MKVKFCPKCKNKQVELVAGGGIGMYECLKCGFRGTIFPEKEINFKEKKKK